MSENTVTPNEPVDPNNPIVPDDKDWTWVLEAPCPECGFEAGRVDLDAVGAAVRSMVPTWQAVLERPDAAVRRVPTLWSDLEYACHVRDVFALFAERLQLMLTEVGPHFANWDQDVTAIEDRYADQDPAVVAVELERAGAAVAAGFDAVGEDEWQRTGFRSDGAAFTVASFARYFLHDPLHHLHDVGAA